MSIHARITVNESGLNDAVAKLRQLEVALPDLLREQQEAFGEAVTKRMQDSHGADAHDIQRYVNRTWDLTESIGYNLEPTQQQGGGMLLHPMRVFASAPYAADVEMGVPGKSRPYPFFWKELTGGPVVEAVPEVLAAGATELLASVAERS